MSSRYLSLVDATQPDFACVDDKLIAGYLPDRILNEDDGTGGEQNIMPESED
jgi:hypothetical protein